MEASPLSMTSLKNSKKLKITVKDSLQQEEKIIE